VRFARLLGYALIFDRINTVHNPSLIPLARTGLFYFGADILQPLLAGGDLEVFDHADFSLVVSIFLYHRPLVVGMGRA
jgi:hypothetical protein